jgi:hypothetical protein
LTTRAKIKLYSDQIIDAVFNNGNELDIKAIFKIFQPFIHIKSEFVGTQRSRKTKKHFVYDKSIGTMTFRINKSIAKKIGLYPWHNRTYKVVYKRFYNRETAKFRTPDTFGIPNDDSLVKKTVHFASISHKDVKKFEFPKLLTWAYKLDKDVFLKIEKILFEKTG